MNRIRTLLILLAFGVVVGCGSKPGRGGFDLATGGGDDDGGQGNKDGGGGPGPCDDVTNPCPKGQRCLPDTFMCVKDNGTCNSDEDCINDSYCDCTGGGGSGDMGACMGGICATYGSGPRGLFDPDCKSAGFSATQFVAPTLKCSYGPTMAAGSLVTPIVADLDGDGKPEITFLSYSTGFTSVHSDCSLYFTKTFAFSASNQSQLAIADLDGDHIPEIVGVDSSNRVVVLDNKGNLKATAPQATGGIVFWGGPAIADLDGVAPPEIVVGGQALRYQAGALTVLWTKSGTLPSLGPLSIVADMDGDHKPEVITGKNVYDGVTGADKTPSALAQLSLGGAFPAIGDFNGDKKPDIVLVADGQVAIVDYANNKVIFGPFNMGETGGGPPTVADFDGDGEPEFATAGGDHYFVFKTGCTKSPKPAACDQTSNIGVLWKKTTQDHSSRATGSSVFDFNGDGKAEVVYRDECFLRVYDGSTGKTIFATPVSSATALELPVIVDLDNDGHSEIVVTADSFAGTLCTNVVDVDTGVKFTTNSAGVFVYQDPMNRWMPSRSLWNQHAYHITNINDDLSVPLVEQDNWLTWNNYRQNVQGAASGPDKPQVDYTGNGANSIDNGGFDCSVSERLWASTCNRGTAVSLAGVPGAFYDKDPRMSGATVLCTTKTLKPLNPGECEAVYCDWANPPPGPMDLWFRPNDDGTGKMPTSQCKVKNDLLFMPGTQCYIPG